MRVLAIGAHFDDVELGCGGTLAAHAQAGDDVTIFVATHSGYSNYAQKVIRQPEIALEEGRAAARLLGAGELICGNLPTNDVQLNDALVCQILRIIEQKRIEAIYTHWTGDMHNDHRAVGLASLTAGRHVPRVLMYRSNFYDTDQVFRGNFYMDISATIETKVQAIKAHESEYRRVGETWTTFFKNQNGNDGLRIGVQYAEVFEVVRYLGNI
ncbi:PIG-L deacetylase family protein [Magnetospirillum gryphiswaldense]|uniref:LmbE-like protein n=1 Tax=Magnetospirillum gryphiswaldense TaxID=55518 RepID=A4U168_9PROT|nr:PIG-L deacetylase family protein [Magnetospirillum gryphiswaldense]AVM75594.1 GlcNAc-PI de-N-acetylase [Magnetospirillum gryphiswaldense MSR-1]AVM79497.1 GlcNAc-PI de-N-acetylase [Magnetospirillum gryphiswaldense]CAM76625.1 LmbE-like protein [Magnetospirillum gryphiswaldense MSR-1]